MVSRWLDAPILDSVVAPWLPYQLRRGYTLLRTLYGHALFQLRTVPLVMESALWLHASCLQNSGLTTIPNFLPPNVFNAVLGEYQHVRCGAVAHPRIRQSTSAGLSTWSAVVTANDSAFQQTTQALHSSMLLKTLVGYTARHMVADLPETYSVMEHTVASLPVEDNTAALHQDVYYPTVKAVLYLTDVGEQDCPFIYVPTSHRLTRERLALEQTIMERRYRPSGVCYGKTPVIDAATLAQHGYRAHTITAPKNTLIIADHFGLHAHGPMRPDCKRVTLRLSFRYLDSRRYRWRKVLAWLR